MSDNRSLADRPPPKKRGRKKTSKLAPCHKHLMTPDIQGPRSSVPKEVFLSRSKWKSIEKRQLLRALRTCVTENDVSKVYTMVPTRARQEVEAEVLRLRNSVVQQGPDLKAPIETWLDFAEEMVHYEDEDHSKCLGRAMSIVSNYETFHPPESGELSPDYKTLYKYIAAVLSGIDPPKLSPLDSAVILDMMHSLADVLTTANTTVQRRVMQWKFSMLNCKVDINNLQDSASRARKALTNVFPDDLLQVAPSTLRKPTNQKTSKTPDFAQPSTSKQTFTGPSSTLSSQQVCQTTPKSLVSTLSSEEQLQSSDSTGNGQQVGQKPLQTSDSEKAISVQQAQKPGPSLVHSNQEANVSRTGETTLNEVGTKRANGVRRDEDEPPPKKGRGRGRPRQGDPPLEKPLLYSLNPFCVPVDVLKLARIRRKRKRVSFRPI